MEKDQLDGLLALKAVADKRSFTAAAEGLNVTPSAISQTIKQLERRLGVALLSRTTRTTRLTEVGERFLLQAGPAIDQILAALTNVTAYAERPSGLLRINTLSYGYPRLAAIIVGFSQKFPDVSVEVFVDDVPSDIFENSFDAGVRVSDIVAKDMIALKLFGPLRFVVAGAPKYLKKAGYPKHPKDLLNHNCIRVRLGQGLYDRWEFEQRGKEFQVQVKGSIIINDSLRVADAAVSGAGLVYTAEDVIGAEVASGKLELVLSGFAATSSGYYLYYPQRSQIQPKLRALIDYIKSQKA